MCGRYGYTTPKLIKKRFDIEQYTLDLKPHYNAAPTQELPVVVRRSPNNAILMKWGFLPFWAKDKKGFRPLINARSETIADSKTFAKAFRERRCIIPANFFFEWKKEGIEKVPYLIKTKDQEMFGFAGVYFEEKGVFCFVILTIAPNDLMGEIHNRMPVILNMENEEDWLNPDLVEAELIQKLLTQYPTDKMEAYPVSRAVNSPAHDSPEIITPQK